MLDLSKISQQLMEMTLVKKQEIQQMKEKERHLFEAVYRFCEDPQAYIEKIDSDTHHFFCGFSSRQVGLHLSSSAAGSCLHCDGSGRLTD